MPRKEFLPFPRHLIEIISPVARHPRQNLHRHDPILPNLLIQLQPRFYALTYTTIPTITTSTSFAYREVSKQDPQRRRILNRLCGALPEVREHRVRRVPHDHQSPLVHIRRRFPRRASPVRQDVVGLGDRCEDGFVEAVQGAEEAGAVAFEGELVLRG